MLKQFPHFSEFSLSVRGEIETLSAAYKPYSDFNFVSLYSWDVDRSTAVSVLNSNLVIRLSDYISGRPIYSILGKNDIPASAMTLLESGAKLRLIPEIVVKRLRQDTRFSIRQDRGAFDYTYLVSELASFAGPKNKRHRNQARKFQKSYADRIKTATTKTLSTPLRNQLNAVVVDWFAKSPNRNRSQNEETAINRLLHKFNKLGLLLTIVYVDNTVVAFSINQLLPHGYAICHFEKARLIHPHIYTHLINQTAQVLQKKQIKYLNWEQDLGIPGLRLSKMRYHPRRYLKKYSVNLRHN
ncbi:DUF2156 domain-containing protein [Candidatus Microgenomates bacterium]|nr:DUF2156 domain-containing protein [Candidatus Microgenomates bacterium]